MPGRIAFPDDEIAFQTTRSLWEHRSLAVPGIPKRTGEPQGAATGTFGTAVGPNGQRYGFFGLALSVVALPAYGLGLAASEHAPEAWRHAVRADHYYLYARSQRDDWTRLVVSATNAGLTALTAWLLVLWHRALGHGLRIAVATGLAYAFATSAWPYTRTFLSEPLSALLLVAAALAVTRHHDARARDPAAARRWLLLAATALAIAPHAHVLNVLALPVFAIHVAAPLARDRTLLATRRAWLPALAIVLAGAGLLALGQWLRFGDPFETGRHGLYSRFVAPGPGLLALLAMMVAPGRSVWLYSPALLVALAGWRAAWQRDRGVTAFVLGLAATRLVFVACRSDWWGGWSLGSRHLVPVIPFLLLPLPFVLARARSRIAAAIALGLGSVLVLHLSLHSMFEWMMRLKAEVPVAGPYLVRSHWHLDASPIVGFVRLAPDVLSLGALRLGRAGHPGLLAVFGAVVALALASAAVLWRTLRKDRPHARRPD